MKKLEFLSEKSKIFIDTNVFVYAMIGRGDTKSKCQTFLNMVNRGKYQGVINTTVISEVFHAILINEIGKKGVTDPVPYLKENPEVLRALGLPFEAVNKIFGMANLSILPETPDSIKNTTGISKEFGMLFNDARMVSSCREERINDIATNDKDFENTGLAVWTP